MSIFAELRRRNVIRVAIAYLVFGWLVLQVADVLFPALHLPDWSITLVAVLLAIGLAFALVFSWVYELTSEGVKRDSEIAEGTSIAPQTGRKLNQIIALMLVVAITLLAIEQFRSAGEAEPVASTDPGAPPVVAVLPFKAVGSDDGGFLAAGLHDDLLTRLAKLDRFRVISRTSMMEYAETAKNMREIGEELGASFILEGGVQAQGGRVRINAQLIDTSADEHVWAETYNRNLTAVELFDVQSELAGAIARQMESSLVPDDSKPVEAAPPANMAAYKAYLRAGQYWQRQRFSLPVVDAIIRDAGEAVRLDPDFALAWARLSDAYSRRVRLLDDEESRRKALEAYARARALQPDLLEVELAWVVYLYHGLDEFEQALAALDNLQGRADGNAEFVKLKSFVYRRLGRFGDAYRAMLDAAQLDPKDIFVRTELVQMAIAVGDCKAAKQHVEDAMQIDPQSDLVATRGAYYEMSCGGDLARARALLGDREFDADWQLWVARQAAFMARDPEWMLELAMRDLPEPYSLNEPRNLLHRATTLRFVGRPDEADALVDDVGEMLMNWDATDEAVDAAGYAEVMAAYYSRRHDKAETLRWHREYLKREYPEDNPDVYRLTNELPFMAMTLTEAGLHDEAVELLVRLFEGPGGYTWRFIDALPMLDVLDGHPGFEALRRAYGGT